MAARISAITMPKWGIEMTEGTITGWRVGEGQRIERARRFSMSRPRRSSTPSKRRPAECCGTTWRRGDTQAVGALIGVIAEEPASDADIARFIESFVAAVVSFDPDDSPAAAAPSMGGAPGEETRVSPIARRVAERLGVDLSKVTGTGRNGRISKEDVEAFAQAGGTAAAAPGCSGGAARIWGAPRPHERASRHHCAPPARVQTIDSALSLGHRRGLRTAPAASARAAARRERRVTVNDLLLRATALALVRHPMVNAQLEGDEILQFESGRHRHRRGGGGGPGDAHPAQRQSEVGRDDRRGEPRSDRSRAARIAASRRDQRRVVHRLESRNARRDALRRHHQRPASRDSRRGRGVAAAGGARRRRWPSPKSPRSRCRRIIGSSTGRWAPRS